MRGNNIIITLFKCLHLLNVIVSKCHIVKNRMCTSMRSIAIFYTRQNIISIESFSLVVPVVNNFDVYRSMSIH